MDKERTRDNAASEIAGLLARGYMRHRRARARSGSQVSAPPRDKPLDDVPPRRKVRGRGDGASQQEGSA